MRHSHRMELTTGGRALLVEAPQALAALERADERARLAGAGIAGTVRLGYTPAASLETLGTILAAVEDDYPSRKRAVSARIPGRLVAERTTSG